MSAAYSVAPATPADAAGVAVLVGELLGEIVRATGTAAFDFDLAETQARLADFLAGGRYFVFTARDEAGDLAGFLTLYEGCALYAGGVFGTLAELYVRPECRSGGLGRSLLAEARALGAARAWTRLEVTTPPLPEFAATLAFYEREGFAVTGGRKLKMAL
ncbi:GNAT family N-acetyltransferase [Acidihalobacter yilgarnensis]|uniref:GNAT family N-acetyltransferase n=1 Tax=Acidihalobacter yilgarnensis TaxID=2819280 RepID=A0A1D8IS36_9GAMM|nr:GNAT family N-acetyltransferase [Acidihalobacter yilgarnensis]AOU99311.1 GNAT family N-acetyltransferase [Acidihalobacter yilgarnensis]